MAKKTKKIETPIDQRETFVSIQKNFADSDFSVEEKLKTLYSLQLIDTEIDKILQLRGELPVEVENLENEIADLKAKVANINAQIEESTKKIAEYKNQIVDYDASIAKYKAQVDHVANSREYDSLSKEIENLGRNDDLKAKKQELATIVESTAKDEEKLLARRAECAAKIDARTMSAYNHIRNSSNNHLAVVSVFNGNACGGCFSTISPQRLIDIASNKKMIICEYCGRILVNPDFE